MQKYYFTHKHSPWRWIAPESPILLFFSFLCLSWHFYHLLPLPPTHMLPVFSASYILLDALSPRVCLSSCVHLPSFLPMCHSFTLSCSFSRSVLEEAVTLLVSAAEHITLSSFLNALLGDTHSTCWIYPYLCVSVVKAMAVLSSRTTLTSIFLCSQWIIHPVPFACNKANIDKAAAEKNWYRCLQHLAQVLPTHCLDKQIPERKVKWLKVNLHRFLASGLLYVR